MPEMCVPTTAARITLDVQPLPREAGPLAGTSQAPLRVISSPSENGSSRLGVDIHPSDPGRCRSVSTGRLSEQPIRITLGGQAYQGSTDSLNAERPMDTGTGPARR